MPGSASLEAKAAKITMKKIVTIALGLCLLGMASVAQAQERKRPARTNDQKKVMKEMTEKYDTDKNGRLDKEERAKISADDKAKMEKAGLGRKKKDSAESSEKKSDSK